MSPQYVLVVKGMRLYTNMEVELVPLVYVRQPEYWGIQVVGRLEKIGLPALAPYDVSIPLVGVTGTKGVEVIGASRSEKRRVPPMEHLPAAIFKHRWVHSHEEDTQDLEVYRPSDFDFPPSFPRPGFEVKKSEKFIRYDPAPNDAGWRKRVGRWSAEGKHRVEVCFSEPQIGCYKFGIVSWGKSILKIRHLKD